MKLILNDMYENLDLAHVRDKVRKGERLSIEDGLRLFECEEPLAVGALAHERRKALHGNKAFYVVNRQVNYTNVCVNGCAFCAFRRDDDSQDGAYCMSTQDVLDKIGSSPQAPHEVHMVGGCHPKLPLSHFEEMLSAVKEHWPQVVLKCFTAVEIAHFAALEKADTQTVLNRLRKAGLDMLPGGGAEIFAPAVRERICPKKIHADEWLRIHEEAHAMGMKTNCTMLFGHLESREDRVDHLDQLRRSQDKSPGYTCFIPLPFLTENNDLKGVTPLTGLETLRTIAISRLMLDNIPHIKAYWVMLGVKTAQAALKFGADDFDGTVVEERIGHEAGASSSQGMTREEIEDMLRGCDCTPVERDSFFNPIGGA